MTRTKTRTKTRTTPRTTYTVRMGQAWYDELLIRCREVGRVMDSVRWDAETSTTCLVVVRFAGTPRELRQALGFAYVWVEVRAGVVDTWRER